MSAMPEDCVWIGGTGGVEGDAGPVQRSRQRRPRFDRLLRWLPRDARPYAAAVHAAYVANRLTGGDGFAEGVDAG